MNTAIIKKLSSKGFGFLKIEGREKDLFFHASGLASSQEFNDLKEGDKVTYEDIENNGKGDSAVGVKLVLPF